MQKGQSIEQDEKLFEQTTHLMAEYQFSIIKFEMKQIESMLQEPEISNNMVQLKELQQKYTTLMTLRNSLAKKLGDRVINI